MTRAASPAPDRPGEFRWPREADLMPAQEHEKPVSERIRPWAVLAHCLEELANHSGLPISSPAGQNLLGAMKAFQEIVDAEAERRAKQVDRMHLYGVGQIDPTGQQRFLRGLFRNMLLRNDRCPHCGVGHCVCGWIVDRLFPGVEKNSTDSDGDEQKKGGDGDGE